MKNSEVKDAEIKNIFQLSNVVYYILSCPIYLNLQIKVYVFMII